VRHVTADSNIWVSGLNWRGKPHEFLNLARSGQIQLAVSDVIFDEFSRILRDKLEWSDERLRDMRAQVARFTVRISQTETLDVVKSEASDNRILECAVAAGSEFVVTGDDHLLRLGTFRGIVLVTVADFLVQFSGARR
jgi:putative PIN family toxin of toxin-antitoxin system